MKYLFQLLIGGMIGWVVGYVANKFYDYFYNKKKGGGVAKSDVNFSHYSGFWKCKGCEKNFLVFDVVDFLEVAKHECVRKGVKVLSPEDDDVE